jgi:hypothetical protein
MQLRFLVSTGMVLAKTGDFVSAVAFFEEAAAHDEVSTHQSPGAYFLPVFSCRFLFRFSCCFLSAVAFSEEAAAHDEVSTHQSPGAFYFLPSCFLLFVQLLFVVQPFSFAFVPASLVAASNSPLQKKPALLLNRRAAQPGTDVLQARSQSECL